MQRSSFPEMHTPRRSRKASQVEETSMAILKSPYLVKMRWISWVSQIATRPWTRWEGDTGAYRGNNSVRSFLSPLPPVPYSDPVFTVQCPVLTYPCMVPPIHFYWWPRRWSPATSSTTSCRMAPKIVKIYPTLPRALPRFCSLPSRISRRLVIWQPWWQEQGLYSLRKCTWNGLYTEYRLWALLHNWHGR